MRVIVTLEQGETSVDIMADGERRIADVIKELHLQGYLPNAARPFMRSCVQERVISTFNTFIDEGIFSGDKLSETADHED